MKRLVDLEHLNLYIIITGMAILIVIISSAMVTGNPENQFSAEWNNSGTLRNGIRIESDLFSVEVNEINDGLTTKYNLPSNSEGVVITEVEGNEDVRIKLRKGDLITGINRKRIDNLKDFQTASRVFDPNDGLFLDIMRGGYSMYVTIPGINDVPRNSSQTFELQNQDSFQATEIAPILGKNLGTGTVYEEIGITKEFQDWINNSKGDYFVCMKCGTMVPSNGIQKNTTSKSIFCPNCQNKMILKSEIPIRSYNK